MWWAPLSRLWRAVSSRNVAIVLLSIVTLLVLIGGVLPDPRFMGEAEIATLKAERPVVYFLSQRLSAGSLARGYFFGLVSVLLIISTVACSIDRFADRIKLKRIPLADLPVGEFDVSLKTDRGVVEDIKSALRLRRWSLREEVRGEKLMVLAEKGVAGYWGSVLFHAILITVLFGLAVYYLVGFYGALRFTEGQSRVISEQELDRVDKRPALGLALPRLKFTLEHFLVILWQDREPIEYAARFVVEDLEKGGGWRKTIRVNEPFSYRGLKFLITYYSFSPNFIFYKDGKTVFDSYVALGLSGSGADSFRVPGEDVIVACTLFPDFAEDGAYYSKTELPRNPFALIKVTKEGKDLYSGLVALGQEVPAGDYNIKFNDLKYWITLHITKETGIGFFFWSAMFGLAGLLLRFMDPDRKVFIQHESGHLSVVSYSRHFEGILKQQTAELVDRLVTKER